MNKISQFYNFWILNPNCCFLALGYDWMVLLPVHRLRQKATASGSWDARRSKEKRLRDRTLEQEGHLREASFTRGVFALFIWYAARITFETLQLISSEQYYAVLISREQYWTLLISIEQLWAVLSSPERFWRQFNSSGEQWWAVINREQYWAVLGMMEQYSVLPRTFEQHWTLSTSIEQCWPVVSTNQSWTVLNNTEQY